MALENVLSSLASDETRFIDLSNQYGQDRLKLDEAAQKGKLDSLTDFSTKLAEHLVWRKKEENKRLEIEGEIEAAEEQIEKEEEEAGSSVSKEEREEYEEGVNQLQKNRFIFDSAALDVQNLGGSFQESEQVRNMSGWKLYGYTKRKAIMAGDSYKAWMEGEMANNDEIDITYGGRTFKPNEAETIQEKSVAMSALRREYLQDRGLLGVNKVLLADHFYKKALPAHSQIMANFEKQDAIEKSFLNEQDAIKDFRADKDFGALVSSLAPLWDKDGKKYGRRGALDKAIEIVKGQMDIGELDDDQLKAIRESEVTINGKTYKVGKHWETRFDKLEEDLQVEQNENLELELKTQEMKGKEIKRDFRKWVKERIKNKEDIKEAHLEKWAEIYEAATGESAPSFITDYKSAEDRDDEQDIKDLKKLRQKRRYLLESDLSDVSPYVYQQMIGFVIEDKPLSEIPKTYDTEAKRKIRAWTFKAVDLQEGERENDLFEEGYWNAYRDYEAKIQDYIRAGEPQKNAHNLALQDIKEEFAVDDDNPTLISKYWNSTKPEPKKVTKSKDLVKNLASGISQINKYKTREEALKGLSEKVLDGSIQYLDEGIKYKEGKIDQIPHYYRRIAEDFEDLSGWDILDAQLKANGDKEGLGDRPPVLEALDDPLLKDLKRKLNKLTNKTQVEQARYDVLDIESFLDQEEGLFAYSVYNSDVGLLTPGLG